METIVPISKLNEKSCVLDAFCHATQTNPASAIEWLGHDGSERGFNTQELIEYFSEEYAFTEIHLYPASLNPITDKQTLITFERYYRNLDIRFACHLMDADGVLIGKNQNGIPHAISWLNRKAHDPSTGRSYELLDRNSWGSLVGLVPTPNFAITKFLKMHEI